MSSKTIPCAVIGAAGRMGQRICQMILDSENLDLAGMTEPKNSPYIGKTLKDALGIQCDYATFAESLDKITADFNIIIDFTFPATSMETVRFASKSGKGAVIGTTGFSEEEKAEIKELSKSFPCVCAPNMSMGVNTLFKIANDVAKILTQGFDVEIIEAHHKFKKDAPSGTAMRLAEILANAYNRDLEKTGVYERKGFIGERTKEEIGIQTIRAGDIVGEHTVMFGGIGERLELVHKAQNRDCFVSGALFAAEWLTDKPNGYYDMQDVLGLK